MMPRDNQPLEAVDRGLQAMFAGGEPAPPAFTVDVLRRIQEARWRRERRLERTFYAGLFASGVLVIVGFWFAFGAFAGVVATGHDVILNGQVLSSLVNISGDAAMKLAMAGFVVTVIASWRRLTGRAT